MLSLTYQSTAADLTQRTASGPPPTPSTIPEPVQPPVQLPPPPPLTQPSFVPPPPNFQHALPSVPTPNWAEADQYRQQFTQQMQNGQKKTQNCQKDIDDNFARQRQAQASTYRHVNLHCEFVTSDRKPKTISMVGVRTSTFPADKPLQGTFA
jgi:hypothetical protein